MQVAETNAKGQRKRYGDARDKLESIGLTDIEKNSHCLGGSTRPAILGFRLTRGTKYQDTLNLFLLEKEA